MKKELLIGTAALALLGGVYSTQHLGATTPVYTELQWAKPTTDAQWAEDIKKENFDIKSTGVLEEMITSHTEKLKQAQEQDIEYLECAECIYWQYAREYYSGKDLTNPAINEELQDLVRTQIEWHRWRVEKLQQSVERMNKEVELRRKGFLVVEGEETGLLGGAHDPQYIRHIHD